LSVEDYLSELERRWSEYYLKMGDRDAAMDHIRLSLEIAVAQKNRLAEGLSYRALGEIFRAKQELEPSREALQTSLSIFAEIHNEYEDARTRLVLGQVEIESGNKEIAMQEFARAKVVFEKLGAQIYAAQASAPAT
jgi:tetratricopeptide (TPR) repeat protein